MPSLAEKYRPATLDDVVGQPKAVATLQRLDLTGRAVLFGAASGSGKTCLARTAAATVADPIATVEIDAADIGLADVREYERMLSYRPLATKPCYAFIVNEVHRMSNAVVSRFLTLLEEPAALRHGFFAFTTTSEGQKKLFGDAFDAIPFASRCLKPRMATAENNLIKDFAAHAKEVAEQEGLSSGHDVALFESLVKRCQCNLREVYSQLEEGVFIG